MDCTGLVTGGMVPPWTAGMVAVWTAGMVEWWPLGLLEWWPLGRWTAGPLDWWNGLVEWWPLLVEWTRGMVPFKSGNVCTYICTTITLPYLKSVWFLNRYTMHGVVINVLLAIRNDSRVG